MEKTKKRATTRARNGGGVHAAFTKEITVQPSDVSCQGALKLKNLLDYFQNTAGLAVENIEGTTSDLIARGYAWVLTRYEIDIIGKMPALDEKFFITTYHDPSHGYNTLRVFEVKNLNQNPIAWAKSSWLLLDLANMRPVKAVNHLPEIKSREVGEISPDFTQFNEPEKSEIIKTVEIPVRFHDLDYNLHVNNAVYFGWVFDECPVDLMNKELKFISAEFRTGAKFGEKVTLNYEKINENVFRCKIFRENIKKPSANFILTWE